MKKSIGWQRVKRALTESLFPDKCLGCGSLFVQRERPSPEAAALYFPDDSTVCPGCAAEFQRVESPLCTGCGLPFAGREGDDHFCEACIVTPKIFGKARAAGVYRSTLMKLIQQYKYKEKIQLAAPLGALAFDAFTRFWSIHEIDSIVPVPLHPRKLRARGFNQAYLLTRKWDAMMRGILPEGSVPTVEREILIKERMTDPQTGLDRRHRALNLRHAFRVAHPGKIAGKRVLLLDDVYTTGATAQECAKTLLSAGAHSVDVLTAARSLRM